MISLATDQMKVIESAIEIGLFHFLAIDGCD